MLDEPFSSLDAALHIETRKAVDELLAATCAIGALIRHCHAEALSLGHEVVVLWHGRLVVFGALCRSSCQTVCGCIMNQPRDTAPAITQYTPNAASLPRPSK
jgi:ABC-type sulfate/molybdate transport systems ATPase subunit